MDLWLLLKQQCQFTKAPVQNLTHLYGLPQQYHDFHHAFIGGFIQKAGFGEMLKVLTTTVKNLKFTYVTIISVVMTAKLMTYSGMTNEIATTLVSATGNMYPAFAPLIGALGAFLTGSGTNANVLFGPLQIDAAKAMAPDYLDTSNLAKRL